MKNHDDPHSRWTLSHLAQSATASLILACASVTATAASAEPAARAEISFDISAGPLARTLGQFAEAANVQFLYDSELAEGIASPGLHGWFDVAGDRRIFAYGILEDDLTPATLLSGGISYTRQDSVPWNGGLPRYYSGGDLHLSRDTCLCFAWNRSGPANLNSERRFVKWCSAG